MKFKYNGRIYNPVNVEKKLKKMGLTTDDVEFIKEDFTESSPLVSDVKLFYYYNPSNGYSKCSIYELNENGYQKISKGQLDQIIQCRKISK